MLMGSVPAKNFYDLRKDPFQMNNVAKDPAYSKQVTKLCKRLMAYLRSTDDPRLVENGKFFETPPMAGGTEKK